MTPPQWTALGFVLTLGLCFLFIIPWTERHHKLTAILFILLCIYVLWMVRTGQAALCFGKAP